MEVFVLQSINRNYEVNPYSVTLTEKESENPKYDGSVFYQ